MGPSPQSDNNAATKAETEADECDHGDQGRYNRSVTESRRDQPSHMQKNAEQDQAANQTKRATALPDALLQQQAKRYQRADHHGGGNKPLPAIAPSQHIPRGLVRQIAVPDD